MKTQLHRELHRLNLLWLQSGGCGGCSMSLLNTENPSLYELFEQAGIDILWHPSLSELSGRGVIELLTSIVEGDTRLDILCVEGAVLMGPRGSGRFHMLSGTDRPMFEWLDALSQQAGLVVAVGSCAAFGGMTAAADNIAEATGMQYSGSQAGGLLPEDWLSKDNLPVINVAGCPVHPGWVADTLMLIAGKQMDKEQLDEFERPRFYSDMLVHHGCPRNEYYEFKASAERPAELGCLMEHLGCLGTQARADCNIRPWNGSGSCLKGGYTCINCTAPEFENPRESFGETPKLGGIPLGLPIDMPKAWFVALTALAKAATPERLRNNATAERLIYPPSKRVCPPSKKERSL